MPPRTRENLELISDVTARKMTFRKRKKNVYKKADELSKLCDIDVCLIVYEADKKKGRPIQPELWPEDRREFNRILNKYKAYEDVPSAGLKRNFELSDFYEAKEKADVETKEKQDGETKQKKLFHKRMEKYSTWDDRIDKFSQDELGKLLQSLEGKIQASTKKIGYMERNKRLDGKQKLAVDEEEVGTSKAPHKVYAHHDQEASTSKAPYKVSDDELSRFDMEWTKSNSALQLTPPTYVHTPMLPSVWISRSQSEKVK